MKFCGFMRISIGAVARDNVTIFFAQANEPFKPNVHWIYAENIELTYMEFKGRGVEIIEDIENKPWNMRQFAIKDLNGHIFYVHHDV